MEEIARTNYRSYKLQGLKYPGNWALAEESCRFIGFLLKTRQFARVMEFGSGFSSVVIANEIKNISEHILVSIDNSKHYSKLAHNKLKEFGWQVNVQFHVFPVRLGVYGGKFLLSYNILAGFLSRFGDFDFVLIDGPHHDLGREAVLYNVFPFIKIGGVVVLDDVVRPDMEMLHIEKWRRYFGDSVDIKVFSSIGNGLAVITKLSEKPSGKNFSITEVFITSLRSIRNFIRGSWRGILSDKNIMSIGRVAH